MQDLRNTTAGEAAQTIPCWTTPKISKGQFAQITHKSEQLRDTQWQAESQIKKFRATDHSVQSWGDHTGLTGCLGEEPKVGKERGLGDLRGTKKLEKGEIRG